jgi:DNA polymerase III delta prime subunit
MKQHTLWIEKYRSQTLEQYIGNDAIKDRIADCIAKNDIPHFIFSGTAGTGKTTLAKLIVNNIKCDYLYLNASDENGIDIIRDKVKGFASSASFNPLKVIILDEADFLTQPAQAALRNIIEEYSINTRFILTCNYIERLIEPLQSRCEINILKPPTKGGVAKHICTNVLDVEKITYEMKDIAQVVNMFYPDIRSIIKVLQQNTILDHLSGENILVIDKIDDNWCKQLVQILNKRDKDAWFQIRQLVADSQVDDFQIAYRYMFEHMPEFSYGNDANLSVILDDFIWRSSVVPDKEINFAAAIAKILDTTKKQIL